MYSIPSCALPCITQCARWSHITVNSANIRMMGRKTWTVDAFNVTLISVWSPFLMATATDSPVSKKAAPLPTPVVNQA